jgi:MYXO-CTERM domain-containing protein
MRTITLFLVFFGTLATSAANADTIVSWGYDDHNQVSGTPSGTGYTAIAHGWNHSLALAADGSIESWGIDFWDQVSDTPSGTGFTTIAHGWNHSLALQVQAGPTVPEPAAILLALLGLALLPRRRRR